MEKIHKDNCTVFLLDGEFRSIGLNRFHLERLTDKNLKQEIEKSNLLDIVSINGMQYCVVNDDTISELIQSNKKITSLDKKVISLFNSVELNFEDYN